MAAGVSDHLWDVAELVALIEVSDEARAKETRCQYKNGGAA